MTRRTLLDLEPSVARCRVLLSVVALFALLVGTMEPSRFYMSGLRSVLVLEPLTLAVMLTHLGYSLAVYYMVTRQTALRLPLDAISTWSDVLFSAAIAYCTSGTGSPFYAFFAFAVVAVGFRAGLRRTLLVTIASVGLYLGLFCASPGESANVFIMRVVYLAIIGYLVGYLGQERLNLQQRTNELAAVEQRTQIARELHDGCVQALAAVNLKLESSKLLLQRGDVDTLRAQLEGLQASVATEHDGLRAYMRSLAGRETLTPWARPGVEPRFSVKTEFAGSGALVDQVLQIIREGVTNIRRHAQAGSASITVQAVGSQVLIAMDDDGIGFRNTAERPWSIASRVSELGGRMRVADYGGGAHLVINLAEIGG